MELLREEKIIDGDNVYEISLRRFEGDEYEIVTVDVEAFEVMAEDPVDPGVDPNARFDEIVAQAREMIEKGE